MIFPILKDPKGKRANISFTYINEEGEQSFRRIRMHDIYYGRDVFAPDDVRTKKEWRMCGYDLDTKKITYFVMSQMSNVMEI